MSLGAVAGAGVMAQSPKAYILTEHDLTGNVEVFQRDYAALVQATVEPYGGRYLARGGRVGRRRMRAAKGPHRHQVFPSLEKAQAWRNSPEYLKIVGVRERETKSRQYIVEGLPEA
jgi:uncharacterized protein (DUF1330 family)